MIHRAPFGSLERFMAVLIEHFEGAFPTWLAPEQVRILPISEKFFDYAQEVHQELLEAGIRVKTDTASEKVGNKIRLAQLDKIPYMLVVGEKEADAKQVSVRERKEGDTGTMSASDFAAKLKQAIEERSL